MTDIEVCDARRFVPGVHVRLVGLDWPAPTPGEEFVRSFGPVERRRRGGHEEFHIEEAVVDPDELAILSERLEQVLRQIRGAVERYSGGVGGSRATVSPASAESGDTIRVVVSYSHGDLQYVDEDDKYSLLSYLRGGQRGPPRSVPPTRC